MYGCRFTNENGAERTEPGTGLDVHDVAMWTGARRNWQTEKSITPDAVVVHRDADSDPWRVVTGFGTCDWCLRTVELTDDLKPVPHNVGTTPCSGATATSGGAMYGCRYTDEKGNIHVEPGNDLSARAVDLWTGVCRTRQEDWGIDKDAIVVLRDSPGAPWTVVIRMGVCDGCEVTIELGTNMMPIPHLPGSATIAHEVVADLCVGSTRYPREVLPIEDTV